MCVGSAGDSNREVATRRWRVAGRAQRGPRASPQGDAGIPPPPPFERQTPGQGVFSCAGPAQGIRTERSQRAREAVNIYSVFQYLMCSENGRKPRCSAIVSAGVSLGALLGPLNYRIIVAPARDANDPARAFSIAFLISAGRWLVGLIGICKGQFGWAFWAK